MKSIFEKSLPSYGARNKRPCNTASEQPGVTPPDLTVTISIAWPTFYEGKR